MLRTSSSLVVSWMAPLLLCQCTGDRPASEPRPPIVSAALACDAPALEAFASGPGRQWRGRKDAAAGQALHAAVGATCAAGVEILLRRGVDPNTRLGEDLIPTPLSSAAVSGSSEIVRALLRAGADPHARINAVRQTALHAAAAAGHPEIVLALLWSGSPVSIRDANGRTPLHYAAWSPDTVRALLERGADPNARDASESTPLMRKGTIGVWPRQTDRAESLRLLLEAGANPHAHTERGETALTAAASAGDVDGAAVLLEAGADPNGAHRLGPTPLWFARAAQRSYGFLQAAELLMRLRAAEAGKNLAQRKRLERVDALLVEAGGIELAPLEQR